MNINKLVDEYYLSSDFNMLSDKSKVDYRYFLGVMANTTIDTKKLGNTTMIKMTGAKSRRAYEVWLKRGISMANYTCSVSRKLYSFAMEMGYAETNPFSTFKRKPTQPRKVVWTKEQLCQFLDYCYADFKYRSLGLIVQMAYEWCQRVGDMRKLQFTSVDFDNCVLNLQQSKRRAIVHLPISEDLLAMLVEQKEAYGFQDYVTPYPTAIRGSYEPYSLYKLSKVARKVMNLCGLPDELRISDLRRTGTTEMVEAGVSMGQIMAVTGHANPNSVKPYMKNTYASAENALTTRKKYAISTGYVPNH
tara:strand:- start:518 stop:1429 length:912 start_codon:yes stop_codon:yes gene_type:complete